MNKNLFNIIPPVFWSTIIGAFLIVHQFQQSIRPPGVSVSAQVKYFNINSNFFKVFHLGQKRLISSFYWVETMLKADTEHYDKETGRSWLYHRFNNIVTLDPNFYEAYYYGGQYLSIIKDEPEAAEILLDKGVEKYPDDFALRYFKAYNSLFELDDKKEALRHYSQLVKHPDAKEAPLVFSIYARLNEEKGNRKNAIKAVRHLYQTTKNEKLKDKLKKQLEELKNKKAPRQKRGSSKKN